MLCLKLIAKGRNSHGKTQSVCKGRGACKDYHKKGGAQRVKKNISKINQKFKLFTNLLGTSIMTRESFDGFPL